jgi:G3E family GTPase
MDILIVAGFLGSGKTTLVLSVIGSLIDRTDRKVVVIVNDFGTVGIDGSLMTKYGLEVMELASGCVCCTLGPDLLQTVKDIEEKLRPDMIVVEPTGVADPQAIIKVLEHYKRNGPIRFQSAVVVDASRFDVILKALGPPMTAQVRAADIIMLNKMDTVPEAELRRMEAVLRTINAEVPIIPISAVQGTNVERFVEAVIGR